MKASAAMKSVQGKRSVACAAARRCATRTTVMSRTNPLRSNATSSVKKANASSAFFGNSLAVSATTNPRRGRNGRVVTKAMFERFTEKAIKVVMLAQEEVRVFPGLGPRHRTTPPNPATATVPMASNQHIR